MTPADYLDFHTHHINTRLRRLISDVCSTFRVYSDASTPGCNCPTVSPGYGGLQGTVVRKRVGTPQTRPHQGRQDWTLNYFSHFVSQSLNSPPFPSSLSAIAKFEGGGILIVFVVIIIVFFFFFVVPVMLRAQICFRSFLAPHNFIFGSDRLLSLGPGRGISLSLPQLGPFLDRLVGKGGGIAYGRNGSFIAFFSVPVPSCLNFIIFKQDFVRSGVA